MLHAPDFLGYEDAIQHGDGPPRRRAARRCELKKIGNDIVTLLGGREIHPINVRVGGFYQVPTQTRARAARRDASSGRATPSLETVRWAAALAFPDFEQDYEFVALRHPDEYPFNEGRLVSSKGLDIAVSEYDEHFVEEHVAALQRAALASARAAAPTSSARWPATT